MIDGEENSQNSLDMGVSIYKLKSSINNNTEKGKEERTLTLLRRFLRTRLELNPSEVYNVEGWEWYKY